MDALRISVVIPTYKRPQLLLRCIEAVVAQDFSSEDYEIIVVSDGEDPETRRALESVQVSRFPILEYYALPFKAGPAAARNFGWKLSRGLLIAFTDDDCIPASGWLTAMWSAYEAEKREEIAFSGNTIVPIRKDPTDYEKNISHLARAEFITANCACTRQALQHVGGFDERFKMAWREDSDLQFKFIENHVPILRVAKAMVTHPVRKAPWGISIKEEKKGMFNALLYKKYPHLYRRKIRPVPPWHYYAIAFFLLLVLAGVVTDTRIVKWIGFSGWLILTCAFAWKRLHDTSRSWTHVSEMLFTSAVIPVLSLYWKLYGSWKYKVLLIP